MKKRLSLFLGVAAIVAVSFGAPAAQSAGAQTSVDITPITDCGEVGNPCPPPQNPVAVCLRFFLQSPVTFVSCVRSYTPPHAGHSGE